MADVTTRLINLNVSPLRFYCVTEERERVVCRFGKVGSKGREILYPLSELESVFGRVYARGYFDIDKGTAPSDTACPRCSEVLRSEFTNPTWGFCQCCGFQDVITVPKNAFPFLPVRSQTILTDIFGVASHHWTCEEMRVRIEAASLTELGPSRHTTSMRIGSVGRSDHTRFTQVLDAISALWDPSSRILSHTWCDVCDLPLRIKRLSRVTICVECGQRSEYEIKRDVSNFIGLSTRWEIDLVVRVNDVEQDKNWRGWSLEKLLCRARKIRSMTEDEDVSPIRRSFLANKVPPVLAALENLALAGLTVTDKTKSSPPSHGEFEVLVGGSLVPARVLATQKPHSLIEIWRPTTGTSNLRIISSLDANRLRRKHTYRTVSYERLAIRWLIQLVEDEVDWWGEHQVGSPFDVLRENRLSQATSVYFNEWDSGGPGAGAEEEIVVRCGGRYWTHTSNEGFEGPYSTLAEALAADEGLTHASFATQEIRSTEMSAEDLLSHIVIHLSDGATLLVNGTEYVVVDGDLAIK
jgi:hypothetical protein